ncbi:oxidoreductase, partial [bacterium]
MRQLLQNFKTGELKLEQVPAPQLQDGFVLVENHFSLISSGTEKSTVEMAKSNIFEKANKRPDLVKQVLKNLRREGVLATLKKIENKLDAPKALGYSSCGVVAVSADFEGKFVKGDRIACAGQDYASHAEIVCVPQNLAVKIPENVSFQEAAFTTVGAIAMQGARQADVRLGEKVCVVGLGLIGQLTCQLLKSNGCSVFGVDISDFAVDLAKKTGINSAAAKNDPGLYALMDIFTGKQGFDKVIITASSKDNEPIVFASEIIRKKGAIVVVGNVKMDIPRDPHFYRKELELRMSTSYGPGRYDPLYEEAGVDYPYSYVRFTENRNMAAFLDLVSKGTVSLKPLITHIFGFGDALKAYNAVLNGKNNVMAVLLDYGTEKPKELVSKVRINIKPQKNINVGFIGAGSFARSYLLPFLNKKDISLDTVVTLKSPNAISAARRFGFGHASTNPQDVLNNDRINAVFIATRHDTHAGLVCESLKNKKNVFVEKPLALTKQELKEIVSAYNGKSILAVGYNRRFSLLSRIIRDKVEKLGMPVLMNFRVNAGNIPQEHWIQDYAVGGGRIIGETCHFIDLMSYLCSSSPKSIFASSLGLKDSKWDGRDNIIINIEFADGSIGNLTYTSVGNEVMEKERLECFAAGNSFVINDFREGVLYENGRMLKVRNKGK